MKPNELRMAIELYFMGIGGEDVYEECCAIISGACVEIFGGDEEYQQKVFYEKFMVFEGKVTADFVDDKGYRHLRLKTIFEKTGIDFNFISTIPCENIDIQGADLLDYFYWCENKIKGMRLPIEELKQLHEDFKRYVPKPNALDMMLHGDAINEHNH